jgi:hypothetical protein
MRAEKQRLTRIIHGIKERFPEGNDIFGYSGITKEGVVFSLRKTYTFLGLLEEINDEVETVWIKRKLAKYFDEISAILKDIDSDTWIQLFDRFLDLILEMRMNVKELYITVTDNPLRVDEDIQKAKEQYTELQNVSNSVAGELETIRMGAEKTEKLLEELDDLKTGLSSANEDAKKIIARIAGIEETANGSSKTIEDVTPKITATFTEVKELQKSLNIESEKISNLLANCEMNAEKTKQRENSLQKQIELDTKIQEDIKQTLQDVNKHGMAGAFLKRKQELKWTAVLWASLSVVAMGILIFISYKFAVDVFNSDGFVFMEQLFKIPAVVAGVWLCWFCAKQFGYTIRIREDYSYKYAISMAFEGYKNETREINKELLEKLLEVTVANISSNPIILYNSKSNHGSPWHELTDGIKNFLKIDVKADVAADTKDLPRI